MRKSSLYLISIFAALAVLTGCQRQERSNEAGGRADLTDSVEVVVSDDGPQATAESEDGETGLLAIDLSDPFGLEGQVLNIYCCDSDYEELFSAYLPDYEVCADETISPESQVKIHTGRIGSTTVRWTIVTSGPVEYRNLLDDALLNAEQRDPDQRVDLFMIPSKELAKYCADGADVALSIDDLGLSLPEEEQYPFIAELLHGISETTRAVTCEVPCGAFVYRRDLARDVFGTDDPDEVAEYVSDWTTFTESARKMKEHGHSMLYDGSGTFFACLSSVGGWVDESGKILVLPEATQWAELTRLFTEEGYFEEQEFTPPSDDSGTGFAEHDSVFGAFMTSSEARRYLSGADGSYGVCCGPVISCKSARWFCAAVGTDNRSLIRDILTALTSDPDLLTQMARETGVIFNHAPAMEQLARDASYENALFGGQNHLAVYENAAKRCMSGEHSYYDAALGEIYAASFAGYINGNSSKDDALIAFFNEAVHRYPDLLAG